MQAHEFNQRGTMFFHVPTDLSVGAKVAAFDIDWTVTHGERHLYPREPDDIQLLPRRLERLRQMVTDGYTVVFFTNQSAVSPAERHKRVHRVATLLGKVGFPCCAFIACGKDKENAPDLYRKPSRGMWDAMLEFAPEGVEEAFYVGDALGRPQDHSDADRGFAEACNIPFYPPEEFFGCPEPVPFPEGQKHMVVFVGAPGSGKTEYRRGHLTPNGFVHVSRDELKTRSRVEQAVRYSLQSGTKNVVIDNTSPARSDRKVFYDQATEHGYKVTVIYFVRDGHGWNRLRTDDRVPDMAYHSFFKKLDPPTEEELPEDGRLFYID